MRTTPRAEVWPALLLVGGCNAVLGLGDELHERTSAASGSSTTTGDPSATSSGSTSSSSGGGAGGTGAGGDGGGGGGGGAPRSPCGCPSGTSDCERRITDPIDFAPTAAGVAVTNGHVVVAGPDQNRVATSLAWIDRRSFAVTLSRIEGDAGEGWLAGTPGGAVAYARKSEPWDAIERVFINGPPTPIGTVGLPRPFAGLTWAGPRSPNAFLAISGSDLVQIDPSGGTACVVATGTEAEGYGVAAGFGASGERQAWTTKDADGDPAAFRYIDQVGCPGPPGGPIPGPRSEVADHVDATTIAGFGDVVTIRVTNPGASDFRVVSIDIEGPGEPLGAQTTNDSHALVMSSTWTYFPAPEVGLLRCDHQLANCQEVFSSTFGAAYIHGMTLTDEETVLYVAYVDSESEYRVACIDLSAAPLGE